MDVREKLVELLTDNLPRIGNLPKCDNPLQYTMDEIVERIADHLIAHGVTVQEWISVKERLPEDNGKLQAFLVCRNQPSSTSGKVLIQTEFFTNDFSGNNNVTHWMPLPQPPKGE